MIRALAQLGKIYEEENGNGIENLLSDLKGEDWYILLLNFYTDGKETKYEGITLEEYDPEKRRRYMYKKGASNGGDITPSSVYNKDDKKPLKSLNRYIQSIKKIESNDFKAVDEYFKVEENRDNIFCEIENKLENKKKYLLSMKINEKYLGEMQEVLDVFQNNTDNKFSFKHGEVSQAQNKRCYVCNKDGKTVNGFTSTFPFYTLDKPGFMTGGFNRKFAWRNYPVCSHCGELLEKGRKYLEANFRDYFAGLNYFIIPNFIFNTDSKESFEQYKRITSRISYERKISLGDKKVKGIMKKEDKILEAAYKLDNSVNFTIMFYEQQNAMFKILENIEDVYPSRIRDLIEKKLEIDDDKEKYPEFDSFIFKKEIYDYDINFQTLKHFFISDKLFLGTIHSIFSDDKFDKNYIMNLFINKIRGIIVSKEGIPEISCIESFMFLKFFRAIQIFRNWEKGEVKTMIEKTEKNKIYIEFIEKHKEVLDTDLKIGMFLEGVLVNRLLSLPEQENKPFYSRLNGLNINEKIAKRILPEAINKLNEYGKGYYWTDLVEMTSEYLLNGEFKSLTNDELSYYFVLGMNLGKKFKVTNPKKEGEELENGN